MQPESTNPGSSPARKRRLPKRVGLTMAKEQRLKRELRKTTCSEPWVEAQIKTVIDRETPGGEAIVYRYRDPKAYPPGGAKTGMVRCPVCGVFTPPNAMEHEGCLDHARHDGWGPSPSALAFQALQHYNVTLEDHLKLAPEDAHSLHNEIICHERKCERRRRSSRKCKRRKIKK
jgi:hypothetical protein